MSISYRTTLNGVNGKNDSFSQVLKEASEMFQEQGVALLSSPNEIFGDERIFATYVTKLTEGMNANDKEEMTQLFENARLGIFQESSMTTIQQVSLLTMPVIRKVWAKLGLKNAIPTEPVKQPRFTVAYTKNILIDREGNEHELPQALTVGNKNAERFNLVEGTQTDFTNEFDIITSNKKPINPESFVITEVKISSESKKDLYLKPDMNGNIVATITHSDNSKKVHILAHVDFATGKMRVAYNVEQSATLDEIKWVAAKTDEFHDEALTTISMSVKTKDVSIGTGEHISAILPVEMLQDTLAMYNIDAALEIIDLMSMTVSQKLEIEIYNFLVNCYTKQFENFNGGKFPQYKAEFDVRPSAGFAGSPKEWREELKTTIDHLAVKMRKDSFFQQGKFVIVCSPLESQLISNVNWTFTSATDERNGVEVNYSLGAFSGASRYEIVASDLIPDGKLHMFYVPSTNKQITYKYYPYSYIVDKGYRDPSKPNVPSVMCTKRHTLECFTNLIAEITIKNNNATFTSTSGY